MSKILLLQATRNRSSKAATTSDRAEALEDTTPARITSLGIVIEVMGATRRMDKGIGTSRCGAGLNSLRRVTFITLGRPVGIEEWAGRDIWVDMMTGTILTLTPRPGLRIETERGIEVLRGLEITGTGIKGLGLIATTGRRIMDQSRTVTLTVDVSIPTPRIGTTAQGHLVSRGLMGRGLARTSNIRGRSSWEMGGNSTLAGGTWVQTTGLRVETATLAGREAGAKAEGSKAAGITSSGSEASCVETAVSLAAETMAQGGSSLLVALAREPRVRGSETTRRGSTGASPDREDSIEVRRIRDFSRTLDLGLGLGRDLDGFSLVVVHLCGRETREDLARLGQGLAVVSAQGEAGKVSRERRSCR